MDSIKFVCIAALIIMALNMIQGRYVFISERGYLVAIGDKWTGCVDYSRINSRELSEDEEINKLLDIHKDADKYGKMIRSEC